MTLIKICGITNLADALAASMIGADALGFNFYFRSPRFISPDSAREIISHLPSTVITFGVFVNEESPEMVMRGARSAGVEWLQLHGDESPEFCQELKGWKVIKALRVGQNFKPEHATLYDTDAIMLDAFSARAHGGTGQTFDWSVARRTRPLVAKLFLAGGLTPENVAGAIASVEPHGVDVCSGVESKPGKKDTSLMQAFINAVRRSRE